MDFASFGIASVACITVICYLEMCIRDSIMHPMVQMGNAPTAWTASTGDYLTANETKTEIKQTVSEIKLTASTSGTSSTIKLTAGGTEITSAQINLSGVVTFSDRCV